MPRGTASSIDEMIAARVATVVAGVIAMMNRTVERTVRRRVRAELASARAPQRPRGGGRRGRAVALTRWAADRRARRVPNFVKELTGLDTKKKIVARYGENATFEKGKALPAVLEKLASEPKGAVKAKPPVIRKKAKAAA